MKTSGNGGWLPKLTIETEYHDGIIQTSFFVGYSGMPVLIDEKTKVISHSLLFKRAPLDREMETHKQNVQRIILEGFRVE